jgi:VanZ family protein
VSWIIFGLYSLGIIIATPYLPALIRFANSRWSSASVSKFVLAVEILIALVLALLTVAVYKKKKGKFWLFLFPVCAIILISVLLYHYLPNPYEFTHFPEYAILSFLMKKALDEKRGGGRNRNSYVKSGVLTGVIGMGDEIYQHFLPGRFFTWYDVGLNFVGGILGLIVYWGLKK